MPGTVTMPKMVMTVNTPAMKLNEPGVCCTIRSRCHLFVQQTQLISDLCASTAIEVLAIAPNAPFEDTLNP